jgi:hypothetical protein
MDTPYSPDSLIFLSEGLGKGNKHPTKNLFIPWKWVYAACPEKASNRACAFFFLPAFPLPPSSVLRAKSQSPSPRFHVQERGESQPVRAPIPPFPENVFNLKNRDKRLSRELNGKMKARLLLLCFLSTTALCAWGQETPPPSSTDASAASTAPTEPITKGQSIYASHHSYFLPIPPILTEVAKAGGFPDQTFVGSDYIGGSKTIQHWNVPDATNKAKAALIDGKTDVLILTPVYLPDDGIEKFAQLSFEHNPNIRVTVMEYWLPFDVYNPVLYDKNYQPQGGEPPLMPKPEKVDHNAATGDELRKDHEYYFRTMDKLITHINEKLGKQVVFVVPMGQAVIALREKIIAGQAPGIKVQEDLFKDQLGHPQPPMQVLEAYCHYAVIYRKSPIGLPVPSVLTKAGIPADDVEPLNRLLQKLAWDAVIHHPLSGVRVP